ncbi:hypothetical protein MFFC18_23050 [Mariniblastus fucicola]|uniref:Uncharacterized protein n=1 Tax=Mariniblastus fucicola TaxID=980251 RepID=A0A5B9PB59_9BACT|nr:hypothetical protein MFFC18_23050 [Mariniblastus fucicola]
MLLMRIILRLLLLGFHSRLTAIMGVTMDLELTCRSTNSRLQSKTAIAQDWRTPAEDTRIRFGGSNVKQWKTHTPDFFRRVQA